MRTFTKVLIAEDEVNIRDGLVDALEFEGYQVKAAADGREAIKFYAQWEPDLIILDVMMPYKSGYDVCREIRNGNPDVPIIMLTAKGEEIDKVLGLELGADDYVTKPFGVRELTARISAILRRTQRSGPVENDTDTDDSLQFGDIEVDLKKMRGTKGDGTTFPLSKREIVLIKYFVQHRGEVVDRNDLLNYAWGPGNFGTTRTLDQHIVQLRKKIESDPKNPRYIQTVYSVGYRFDPE